MHLPIVSVMTDSSSNDLGNELVASLSNDLDNELFNYTLVAVMLALSAIASS